MIVLVGLSATVVFLFWVSQRFRRGEELGAVSGRWLAEYRRDQES